MSALMLLTQQFRCTRYAMARSPVGALDWIDFAYFFYVRVDLGAVQMSATN